MKKNIKTTCATRSPIALQSLSQNINPVFYVKDNRRKFLEVMSPCHSIAEQVIHSCWSFLQKYIPDKVGVDAQTDRLLYPPKEKPSGDPFEEESKTMDMVSTVMHKLSGAYSQLYSIEDKLQSYVKNHEAPEFKVPDHYESLAEAYHYIGKEGYPQIKDLPETVYEKGRKRWEKLEAQSAPKPSSSDDDGDNNHNLDPWEPLRIIKELSKKAVKLAYPFHFSSDHTLLLSWKSLQTRFNRRLPETLEELNAITSTIHKYMCAYSQLITLEIKALEHILNNNFYEPKKPNFGPPPPTTDKDIAKLEEELGTPNHILPPPHSHPTPTKVRAFDPHNNAEDLLALTEFFAKSTTKMAQDVNKFLGDDDDNNDEDTENIDDDSTDNESIQDEPTDDQSTYNESENDPMCGMDTSDPRYKQIKEILDRFAAVNSQLIESPPGSPTLDQNLLGPLPPSTIAGAYDSSTSTQQNTTSEPPPPSKVT